jgi:hypothetical protein
VIYLGVRKPVEHGNTTTSVILGISSITLAIITRRDVLSAIFWIPIWMGLFLYDIPIRKVFKSVIDIFLFLLILLISVAAIYLNHFLIAPYLIFLATYAGRNYLSLRRVNFVGTALGILAYILLFVVTIGMNGYSSVLLIIALFFYMIGSEFTVRSKLTKNGWLLVYDVLPPLLFVLSPVFLVFLLSIIRIPVALKSKGLKLVGITETVLLLAVTLIVSLFYVLKW